MKTLLVLSQSPDLPGAVRAALNPEQYRVLHRATLEDAEPFLANGLADGCVLDMEVTDVQAVWLLEKIRRRAPNCPTIIYTGTRQSDWEEEVYLRGAAHVLTKPVRARMLNALMERLWPAEASSRQPAHGQPNPLAKLHLGSNQLPQRHSRSALPRASACCASSRVFLRTH